MESWRGGGGLTMVAARVEDAADANRTAENWAAAAAAEWG